MRFLGWIERVVFFFIGLLLFAVALVLLVRAAGTIMPMLSGGDVIANATAFLDLILLVLMVVELAYTVLLSLRGAVLVAEPFLIVGLIAVIRRILVITVGEVQDTTGTRAASAQSLIELGVLTGIVLAFVIAIVLLRTRPRDKSLDVYAESD